MERFRAGSGLSIVTEVACLRDQGRRVLLILMASLLLATSWTVAAGVSHHVFAAVRRIPEAPSTYEEVRDLSLALRS
jgi:hypothetical protein